MRRVRKRAVTSRGARYWTGGAIPLIAPEILGDIISSVADLSIVVTAEGRVLSVLTNSAHRTHGRLDHWIGIDLRRFLALESAAKLDVALAAASEGRTPRPAEMNHAADTRWDFPVRYGFHQIGPDGAVLMLGHDMEPIAEMQQQLVRAQLALERDYEDRRSLGIRYRALMEAVPTGMLLVAEQGGGVLDANDAAAEALGIPRARLEGGDFAPLFADGEGGLLARLSEGAESDPPATVDARLRRGDRQVPLVATAFRAGGERLLLVRFGGQDSAPGSSALAARLEGLWTAGADGIVFTDASGIVLAANEAFTSMVDASRASDVRGRSLGDHLGRGSVDLGVLLEQSGRSGRMRLYATRLLPRYGEEMPVEIAACALPGGAAAAHGFVFREALRDGGGRRPGAAVGDDAARSVMELVGQSTLREIVSETTDVVEKMCIETAVELTSNNRVAAAEMLGLSRQSLYVKLRKYDLLKQPADD